MRLVGPSFLICDENVSLRHDWNISIYKLKKGNIFQIFINFSRHKKIEDKNIKFVN